MRDQVIVLPSSIERSFRLSKQEEAVRRANKERRIWAVSERENAENMIGFILMERDPQHTIHTELALTKTMRREDAREPVAEGACKEERQHGICGEDTITGERVPSSNGDGGQVLQWGLRKRSRLSREETLNAGSRADNHSIKPAGHRLADEASVPYRNTARVQVDRAKGTLKAKNAMAAKRELLLSEKMQFQQAKVLKGGTSDAKQGANASPVVGKRRNSSPNYKQDHLHQQEGKPCTLADPDSSAKNGLVWPKFVIALSRNEKEEDFLMFKGSKLPQRPKRRPKAAEKALRYCSPGSWLVDLSISRYDVREKKHCRKRRRGLKAMESLDSDSD